MRVIRTRFLLLLLAIMGGGIVTLSLLTDLDVESELFQPTWLFGSHNSSRANDVACYYYEEHNSIDINEMEEIDDDNVIPGSSIFFHETSCHDYASTLLSARQACAVESAAKMNPDSQVYVFFSSPIFSKNFTTNNFIRLLKSYENIQIRHINMERYFGGSPLEDWYKSGQLLTSDWPRSHASDLLRYLTLWKFGGIYLDLDVVVVKSLKGLTNFAGAESDSDVAAGVLSFSHNGTGHDLATVCVNELKDNFRGYDWGYNGPGVITRMLKKSCKVRNVKDMKPERCKGFHVYPPSWFYPIPWSEWRLYFNTNNTETVMDKLDRSYVIHVWNKFSRNTNVNVGSNQPYGLIAAKYCPKIYANTGLIF
ncbi:lactosylceramide 4-alpha-galactosyltransferase-like [Lycorma delicatula]|uniref:lactosylceramide 4-alpha-galactosyltransferase-like n=1 Tax=Lycorma delicatula TaxID=130591 RepID=UPI003F5136EE